MEHVFWWGLLTHYPSPRWCSKASCVPWAQTLEVEIYEIHPKDVWCKMKHAFEGFFGLGTISWGLKLETCFLLEFPAWSGDVMTSSPPISNGGAWGPLNEAWKFWKKPPQPKNSSSEKRWRFFFFFRESRRFRDLPKVPRWVLAEPKPHPGLEVNKWGVMKVAGDEMKGLDVNVPRFQVVGWLFMVGRLDDLWRKKTIGFP